MKNKRSLFAIVLVVLFGIIGGTIAYYQSNDTFTNEFNTGNYVIKAEETFESPDNWIPGDTTEKKISVKNEGNVDAAVKVCFREKWEDKDGNTLPTLKNSNPVAILNYKQGYRNYWLEDCNQAVKCFYYYKKLEPNETTEDLLESVTFNSNVVFNNTTSCTDDPTTHKKSCTTTVDDYSDAKYTLNIDIETVQYNSYQNVFNNVEVIADAVSNYSCSNINLLSSAPTSFRVGYRLDNSYLKESELSDIGIDSSNPNCNVIYVNSVSEENKYYYCRGIIYYDNLYSAGDTVNIKAIRKRYISGDIVTSGNNTIIKNYSIDEDDFDSWGYRKDEYAIDSDRNVMNFNVSSRSWEEWDKGFPLSIESSNSFVMPRHSILFKENAK